MALETARQQIAVNNMASPVGVEVVAERRGAYRGESVRAVGDNSRIAIAGRQMGAHAAMRTDIASLMRRVVRQGQGGHMNAAARIAEWRDKLPQMPEQAALINLVQLMQQLSEELPAMILHAANEPHGMLTADADDDVRDRPRADDEESADKSIFDPGAGGAAGGGGMRRYLTHQSSIGERQAGDGQPDDTPEAMRRVFAALEDFDGDVTHQFAALDILQEEFAAVGADDRFQNLLAMAAARFETPDLSRDVRAGLAAARIADQAAQTLQTDPAAVRETYREMLRGPRSLGQLFAALSTYDLSRNFEAVVELFRAAAGNDLSCTGPSTDPAFLGHLLTELGHLKKMLTTFEGCQHLIEKTERLLPARERGLATATQVTSELLSFASASAVGPSDARRLLGGIAQATPEGQVVFANGLRILHSDIPDEVIPSTQARLQQMIALQSLQNTLVAAEEAHHAAR